MRRARARPQHHHRHSGFRSGEGGGEGFFTFFFFLPSVLFFSSNVETQSSCVQFFFHVELLCPFQRKMQ